MKLKDYIREGYNIVTTPNLAYKIQEDYPNVLVFTDRALDAIPIGKLLVDRYYRNNPAVLSAKPLQIHFIRIHAIRYHYHTTGDGSETPDGANDISIEYYDTSDGSNHLDKKIIGHKREM